jgi:hypothetical protein
MKPIVGAPRRRASLERMGAMFAAILMSIVGFEIASPPPSRGDESMPRTSNTWRADAATADASSDKTAGPHSRSAF